MSYLEGKSILISGASSGIGAVLARELARRGARVGLLARRAERLEALAAEIEEAGGQAAWAVADVADAEALCRALDDLARELDGVDMIIANAGYGHPENPAKLKPGTAERMYDINLFGMLRMIDWALPGFWERRSGHIVGVASMASYLGMPNSASYCGSKAAMRVHLQSLRVSLKRRGIAVTTLCPGFVDSELTRKTKAPMPFFWPTDRAVRYIADALERRRGEVMFPWQMRWIIQLLARLPTALSEWLIGRMAK